MKIFGPKFLAPACAPDRALSLLARSNRHRINRLVIEARKGRRAAALLFSRDALYIAILSWFDGKACFRCIGEYGEKLFYDRGSLTSRGARFTIARLIANINADDNLPL